MDYRCSGPPRRKESRLMRWFGSLDTWVGMAFVLGGIALCVQSKRGELEG